MNTNLKKVVWTILLCVLVLSTILALLQRQQASSVQHSIADIRRTMREQGFKTDLGDFTYTNDAATQARVTILTTLINGPQLDPENDQLDLLPAATNATATVLWKLDSLKVGTNVLHWSDLHAILDTNLWALDAAREAALAGPIRFDADASRSAYMMFGLAMFGLEPMSLENLSDQLDLRILLELHEGNPDAAWTNLLATTRLVTACEAEPTGISQCAQVTMAGTAFAEAWQLLQKGNWPDEKLAALQQEWESADFFTNLIESTVIDHATDVYNCQQLFLRNPWGSFSLSTLIGQTLEEPANAYAEIKGRAAIGIYRHQGVFADEKGLMLYFQRRALELRQALQATNWAEMRALPGVTNVVQYVSSNPEAEGNLLNNHGLDNFMLALAAQAEAQRRVILTAIALERYRGKHGTYPATLAPLAPEFLNAVPEDFMDGQPLHYRFTDDGHFVLYSVGLDCTDDGGMVSNPSPFQWIQYISQSISRPFGSLSGVDIVWPRPTVP